MTDLETRVLAYCEKHKTVTAQDVADALKIEWTQATDILYRLLLTHQRLTEEQVFMKPTMFHYIEV